MDFFEHFRKILVYLINFFNIKRIFIRTITKAYEPSRTSEHSPRLINLHFDLRESSGRKLINHDYAKVILSDRFRLFLVVSGHKRSKIAHYNVQERSCKRIGTVNGCNAERSVAK